MTEHRKANVPPARLPGPVKELRVLQRLLRRDMAREGLSLRGAAKQGPIALGTLCHYLDERRVTESALQPKRLPRRATLLELQSLSWAGSRTKRFIASRLRAGTAARRS